MVRLQEALNDLGCDVGAADGVPGKLNAGGRPDLPPVWRWRDAPVARYHDRRHIRRLYTSEGGPTCRPANCRPNRLPITYRSGRVGKQWARPEGGDGSQGLGVRRAAARSEQLSVLAIGEFSVDRGTFDYFALLLNDDLGGDMDVETCRDTHRGLGRWWGSRGDRVRHCRQHLHRSGLRLWSPPSCRRIPRSKRISL